MANHNAYVITTIINERIHYMGSNWWTPFKDESKVWKTYRGAAVAINRLNCGDAKVMSFVDG